MGQTVGEIAIRSFTSIGPTGSVSEAVGLANDNDIPYVIVRDQGGVRGIVCRICDLDEADPDASVTSVMSSKIVRTAASASIDQAAEQMKSGEIGCLFVYESDDLVGIVTRGDLVRAGLELGPIGGGFVCAACGTNRHVHTHGQSADVAFCEECWERSRA